MRAFIKRIIRIDKKEKKLLNYSLRVHVVILVYWGVITGLLTWYNITHWSKVINFTFFSEFNGDNMLFLLWLICLIAPIFGKFEGFGIKIEALNKEELICDLRKAKEEADKLRDENLDEENKKIQALKEQKEHEMEKIYSERGVSDANKVE